MSELNLKAELKKGYLMFRAFENALKLSDELEGLEQTITLRKSALADLEKTITNTFDLLEEEKEKLAKQLDVIVTDNFIKQKQIEKDFNEFKKTFDDKYKPLTDKLKKVEDKIVATELEYNNLSSKLADKKAEFDALNKGIEETKSKFRSMF